MHESPSSSLSRRPSPERPRSTVHEYSIVGCWWRAERGNMHQIRDESAVATVDRFRRSLEASLENSTALVGSQQCCTADTGLAASSSKGFCLVGFPEVVLCVDHFYVRVQSMPATEQTSAHTRLTLRLMSLPVAGAAPQQLTPADIDPRKRHLKCPPGMP